MLVLTHTLAQSLAFPRSPCPVQSCRVFGIGKVQIQKSAIKSGSSQEQTLFNRLYYSDQHFHSIFNNNQYRLALPHNQGPSSGTNHQITRIDQCYRILQ